MSAPDLKIGVETKAYLFETLVSEPREISFQMIEVPIIIWAIGAERVLVEQLTSRQDGSPYKRLRWLPHRNLDRAELSAYIAFQDLDIA
jgi:hypothetical protein